MKTITITVTEIKAFDNADSILVLKADGKLTQKECKEICKNSGVRYMVHSVKKESYEIDECEINTFVVNNGKPVAIEEKNN